MGRLSTTIASLALTVIAVAACAQDCEWCGAAEAPENPGSHAVIAGPDEPGERMLIHGTVYGPDGETPAPGVLLYVYHTNADGVYPKRGDETGNGRRHGFLRAWLVTDQRGRYSFESIRPAPYHSHGGEPAHVHMTVTPPGGEEFWVHSIWFEDDPRVTPAAVADLKRPAGDPVVQLERDGSGRWVGRRDVVMPTELQ